MDLFTHSLKYKKDSPFRKIIFRETMYFFLRIVLAPPTLQRTSARQMLFKTTLKESPRGSFDFWSNCRLWYWSKVTIVGSPNITLHFNYFFVYLKALESLPILFIFFLRLYRFLDTPGIWTKLAWELLSLLFMPKVALYFFRFGMWDGFQIWFSYWNYTSKYMDIFQT